MADPVTATVAIGWGMKAVGWLASPIISELYKKGSSILGFDASEKLKELEPKVLLLERLLEVVVESPDRSCLEQLFQELKSTFHEAEDILDDVDYHHLERQIHDDKLKAGLPSLIQKFQTALPSSPLKDKETGMSKKKLLKTLDKIERIINEAYKILERLNLSSISHDNRRQNNIATSLPTTGTPAVKVIGRDEDRDKIITMLHEKEGDGQSNTNVGLCYSVVGIHGISGSGKSTLAQLVCAQEKKDMEERKDDHFDLVMWVHVSQKFSLEAIYRDMIVAASHFCPLDIRFLQLQCSFCLDFLQSELKSILRDQRFFLVLDDVWCNNQNLPHLLTPLKAGKIGSKILVTSRNADALSDLGPDVKSTPIPIHDLKDDDFLNLFMYYALGDTTRDNDQDMSTFWNIGAQIAQKLKRSPLAASIVGGQLRRRKNVEFWRRAKDQELLNETMGALSWSYQHLDPQARQCFAYCSIFPERHPLRREELVRLWVAEGFIRNSDSGKEPEDVAQEYFDGLVSTSFLQLGSDSDYCFRKDLHGRRIYEDYYIMHDLLHLLAERVAGSDCFRIENGWTGKVPPGVGHLFVDNYNEQVFKRIVELENLRTLIINRNDEYTQLEPEALDSMFKRLRKLRVLRVLQVVWRWPFSLPESIGLLKHLRFLEFRLTGPSCGVMLPITFNKLYHMQVLNFGSSGRISLAGNIVNLVNLRYATSNVYENRDSYDTTRLYLLDISRSISLQKLPFFRVRKDHKLKLLRDINKISGHLQITHLQCVESKEEALEAKLADKKRLKELELNWNFTEKSPEDEAKVLEGLCPPMCLEVLRIKNYSGATYPNWMVDKTSGSEWYLQKLELSRCSRVGPVPELFEVFVHLSSFSLSQCTWDALPDSIEHLKLLKTLKIHFCFNIRSLPALPQSLETFQLNHCDQVFMRSCQTIGDPNWQKIKHIPNRGFLPSSSSPSNTSGLKSVTFDDNVSII